MSEYPKEIEGIIVNNSMEEQIAREELARAKIKLQVKNKKTFAKVQVAAEQMKESINQLTEKEDSLKRFNAKLDLEQEQKRKDKDNDSPIISESQVIIWIVFALIVFSFYWFFSVYL